MKQTMETITLNEGENTIEISARNIPGEVAYRAVGARGTGFGQSPAEALMDYVLLPDEAL